MRHESQKTAIVGRRPVNTVPRNELASKNGENVGNGIFSAARAKVTHVGKAMSSS
jgi:hypothetical protein